LRDFSAAIDGTKELRTGEVLDALNDLLGPHIFPPKADGGDPRACPTCGNGTLSLKLGKFGSFVGCSNYPECRYTRPLAASNGEGGEGGTPGTRILGEDPETGLEVSVRDGRFGTFIQLGEATDGEKPKRSSIPKGMDPAQLDIERALALLSLPREVTRHPESGEPILAGIGRFGPYVQHGKTYASLGRDDDVLEIGGNRAIDLIIAKEQGGGRGGRTADPGRALGDDPETGKPVVVKAGRYGPYVTDGETNATLPKGQSAEAVTIAEAAVLLAARRAAGPSKRAGTRRGKASTANAATAKTAAKTTKAAAKKPAAKSAARKPAAKKAPAKG